MSKVAWMAPAFVALALAGVVWSTGSVQAAREARATGPAPSRHQAVFDRAIAAHAAPSGGPALSRGADPAEVAAAFGRCLLGYDWRLDAGGPHAACRPLVTVSLDEGLLANGQTAAWDPRRRREHEVDVVEWVSPSLVAASSDRAVYALDALVEVSSSGRASTCRPEALELLEVRSTGGWQVSGVEV